MQLELTSPALGKSPGENVTVEEGYGRWLIANGYAKVEDDGDHRTDTSVEASADPTLATNREAPGDPIGSIANDPAQPSHTEQHLGRAEYTGKAGETKVVPGSKAQETGVTALGETVDEAGLSNEAFDPSEHSVDEVNAYLEGASEVERERVLAAEKAGKDRSTVKA